jgi:hypothetical protein
MLNNGKIIKWLGLTPIRRPEIKVKLIPELHGYQPINYGGISVGECTKIGIHQTTYKQATESWKI